MIDRIPPHDLVSEKAVLGCLILECRTCLPECVALFKGDNSFFYDLRNRTIFETIYAMSEALKPVDSMTLFAELQSLQIIEAVGGFEYVQDLPDGVGSTASLPYYLGKIKNAYALRRMIAACVETVGLCYEPVDDLDTFIDAAEAQILGARIQSEKGATHIKAAVLRAITRLEEYHQNKGKLMGISSGFPDLDKLTSGFRGGQMIVLAARPSIGKSSIAMNIVEAVAIDQKLPVGVFSLEMTEDELVERLIGSRGRVNIRNMKEGVFLERDFPRITSVAGKLCNAPIYIDDTGGLSILQLRAKARRMWQQYGIKLFVIDYMQLMNSTAKKASNRQQEVGDISRGVKSLAKELNVPVIVLAQLNRELEKDKNRKPRTSDLRESGDIEQDADIIGLLYRPDGEDADQFAEVIPINLLLGKNRGGPTGELKLTFLKQFTRFESAAKIEPETQEHWQDR